ncbi:hypothetical protein BGZ65_008615, partial [Modicella reniformis]
ASMVAGWSKEFDIDTQEDVQVLASMKSTVDMRIAQQQQQKKVRRAQAVIEEGEDLDMDDDEDEDESSEQGFGQGSRFDFHFSTQFGGSAESLIPPARMTLFGTGFMLAWMIMFSGDDLADVMKDDASGGYK